MRAAAPIALLATMLAALVIPVAVWAQETDDSPYNHVAIISDLNALAIHLDKKVITQADVLIIAGIACADMRVAVEERVAERVTRLLAEQYPSELMVANVDYTKFVDFEEKAFRDLGATEQAIAFVKSIFEERAFVPTISPAIAPKNGLAQVIQGVERVSCDIRGRTPPQPATPASEAETEMARQLGMAVVGVSAIVVDATIAVGSSGVGGTIFGMISGGWGWNRCEEAWPTIEKLWGSIFD